MYVPAQPPPSWQLSGEAHWVNFLVGPEHESCSERALACQLTRPVIYPFCFCLIAFQAIQTPGCPLTFTEGWPSPRFQQARQHCPEPWGHSAPANRGGLSMPAGPEGSRTPEELGDASAAMRAPGVCLLSGAQLRRVIPSSLSPRPPYAMGVSALCLPHRCILGPQTLPGFTGSQRERNSASG